MSTLSILIVTLSVSLLLTGIRCYDSSEEDASECSDARLNEATMECIFPHIFDYILAGDDKAIKKKFMDEDLSVPCDKVRAVRACFKANFSECTISKLVAGQALGAGFDPDAFDIKKIDKALDFTVTYVCDTKYSVFNSAKNCMITNFDSVGQSVQQNCKSYSMPSQDIAGICAAFDAPIGQCIKRQFASACGQPVADAFIELTKNMFGIIVDCKSLTKLAVFEMVERALAFFR